MYDLIENHGGIPDGVTYARNLYLAPGNEVIDVYVDQKQAGANRTTTIAAMEQKIIDVGPETVSSHCSTTRVVFDVAPSSIDDDSAFEEALAQAKASGTILKFLTPQSDASYHIEAPL